MPAPSPDSLLGKVQGATAATSLLARVRIADSVSAYAVTGEVVTALAIGSVEPVVKLAVYYLHERAWQYVPVGTIRRLAHLRRR